MISDWKKHIYWKLVRRVSYMTSSNSGINLIIEIFKAPVKWHGFFWNKGHLHTKTYKCLYLVCAKDEQAMKSMYCRSESVQVLLMGVICLNLMQFLVIILFFFYKYAIWVQNVKSKSVFDCFFFFFSI